MTSLHTLTDTDWPFWPHCAQGGGDIRPGQRYAILRDGLTVICAACTGRTVSDPAAAPSGRPAPVTSRPLGKPLAPGQWSRDHERCVECGQRDRPPAGRGVCARCVGREQRRRRAEQKREGVAS